MINFDTTREEDVVIADIATRAIKLGLAKDTAEIRTQILMDISATHMNGCPLKLTELLEASDVNFTHDLTKIHTNLDRNTGRLTNNFIPRYSVTQ